VGVIGELYVGGVGLARGYLNSPELTQDKFVSNPFSGAASDKHNGCAKLYKTGDLVRWLADGNIEYIRRNDFQIKIRGYRIELGEIESQLANLDTIKQSVVLSKVNAETDSQYLVGYYVPKELNTIKKENLFNQLSKILPDYMVPSILVEIENLPLTINGKLDYKALPDPEIISDDSYVEPTTELEVKICNIWSEVLGLKKIGITDNFFRIGGNSILAIKLSYRLSNELDGQISVADVFTNKTVSELSKRLHLLDNNLLKVLSKNISIDKENMFFIHPGYAGCEVYTNLSLELESRYNCYGIDNYNINNEEQISDIKELAKKYKYTLDDKILSSKQVILIGWSIGGKIALEIAYLLEQEGYSNIKVYLFDTFIVDYKLKEFYSENINIELPEFILEKQYDKRYLSKVNIAAKSEYKMMLQNISGKLKYTECVLYKATQPNDKNNNVDLVSDNLDVINVDANHGIGALH
jgi:pimeloyl-ACP methyl ester carboxylesterase